MLNLVITLFFLQSLGFSLFALYSIREQRKAGEQEATRFSILAESALNHIRAKSLEEMVQAQAVKESHNLQLEVLRDTYAKEKAQKKAALPPEPIYVKAEDGSELDLRDYEILG